MAPRPAPHACCRRYLTPVTDDRQTSPPSPADASGITRRQLELVIRRAAELTSPDAGGDERLSEAEVVRIGQELGLPARSVRQALYEAPSLPPPAEPGPLERLYGEAEVRATRALRGEPAALRRTLEEYFTNVEHMQPRRRMESESWFVAAQGGPLVMVERLLGRSSGNVQIPQATRVVVAVHPLEEGWAHVRLEADLSGPHRSARQLGTIGGPIWGLAGGSAVGIGVAIGGVALGLAAAVPVGIGVGLLAAGGVAYGTLRGTAAQLRRRMLEARQELEGILDRLEDGESLAATGAPFWKRLSDRIGR